MNLNTEQYFSTVPDIHCPRSVFDRSYSKKFTMDCDYLYPFFIDEALPGDSFKISFQIFGRLENPLIRPVMDELYLETLWFKIPNRLVWSHWVNFCGEQDNPDDSTDYMIPIVNIDNSADDTNIWTTQGIFDIFGIPFTGHFSSGTYVKDYENHVNALPLRAYNLVYNQWFRDENLQDSVPVALGDDEIEDYTYTLLKSNKIHDYFTSCLPFAQKGDPVMLPLGLEAPITADGKFVLEYAKDSQGNPITNAVSVGKNFPVNNQGTPSTTIYVNRLAAGTTYDLSYVDGTYFEGQYHSGLVADLTNATGASINDFRFAFMLQAKRERDARGGTRYIEWIKSQFNVDSPDGRLQRTEFLGSTRTMLNVNTVVQTSSSDTNSPQGNLTGYGLFNAFESVVSTSFVEHSYILGICRIRHNPIYQQGISKLWKRQVLLDFYLPVFVGLGEQPVYNYEIYNQGMKTNDDDNIIDDLTFGFQPAWSDYRFCQNQVCGYLRSGVDNSLDVYHFAEQFTELPLLNDSFIQSNVPITSKLALPTDQEENNFPQFVMDVRFNVECARPIPVFDIPATLSTHF